jgi:hypothetical protein
MSKGGGKTTTVQSNDPWKEAQPFLKQGMSDLASWYSSPYGRNPFPGSTVVPFHPLTEQSLGMVANRAISGSPLTQAAQAQNIATQRGDYLNPESNPFLSKSFDLAAGKVRGALDSQFNQSGSYGSSLHQGAMTEQMGDLATKMYGGQYDAERNRQIQATLFAPNLAQQDYFDASQLAAVGDAYQQQAGNYTKEALDRWNFYQNAPYQRLQNYFGVLNPTASPYGTQSSTSKEGGGSALSNIIGTAASIASLPIWSDRDAKTDIVPTNDDDLIAAASAVPGYAYTYKTIDGDRIGPMADEFAAQYGGSDKMIPMPVMLGVMWSTMSAMARRIRQLENGE